MLTTISAAFILPTDADLRAILFALADLDVRSAIHASVERANRFDPDILWIVAEGVYAQDDIDAAMALLPTFGLTHTQV